SGNWGQQHSGVNYHFIRYADVLLMAAEAAVETNDLTKALGYVNQVRERALNSTTIKATDGVTDAANYDIGLYQPGDFGSQDMARTAVRMERRLELGMEGHRLFDLRRWGNMPQVMNDYVDNESRTIPNFGPKTSQVESKHNLFPVPVGAIDQSSGTLGQNPDWGS
ncbi:MAG: RagB/SusD family nutrient uptake outer membrane protein, partial [Flavobacteriaceae bacterium]